MEHGKWLSGLRISVTVPHSGFKVGVRAQKGKVSAWNAMILV